MKITIEYESSWRNSFLDGSNDEPLPKTGRKYIASNYAVKTNPDKHFIERNVSINTVMGVLNRLIGDQRKLYQSKNDPNYFFKNMHDQNLITFKDNPQSLTNEIVFLRNISGNTDPNSFTGAIKSNDPIFVSDYSLEFWGVLDLSIDELYDFIKHNKIVKKTINMEPFTIVEKMKLIGKMKSAPNTGKIGEIVEKMEEFFNKPEFLDGKGNIKFKPIDSKGNVRILPLYCSALYIQLNRLSQRFNMDSAKSPRGGLPGIANNGIDIRDFMTRFTTGEKKRVWGNPYVLEQFIKNEGKIKKMLTKACGKLEIFIDIDKEKGREIKTMIEDAGVSSFYLGKKGIAFTTSIRT